MVTLLGKRWMWVVFHCGPLENHDDLFAWRKGLLEYILPYCRGLLWWLYPPAGDVISDNCANTQLLTHGICSFWSLLGGEIC